jgi:hypothetical protein
MAIERYTGDGGTGGLMTKLQELYEFKKVTESTENRFQLYITDEIYIDYYTTTGWADVDTTNGVVTSFNVLQNNGDNRTWRIYKTSHGIAFALDGCSLNFISDIIDSNGKTGTGVLVCERSTSNSYKMIFDGMGSSALAMTTFGNDSVYFTALVNAVYPKNTIYFPHLHSIIYSPITGDKDDRKIVVDGTTYIATKNYALEE